MMTITKIIQPDTSDTPKYEVLSGPLFEIKIDDPSSSRGTKTLFRIRALRSIPGTNVRKGQLGGYIDRSSNLSHSGACWIYAGARVYASSTVREDAAVRAGSTVRASSVRDNAIIDRSHLNRCTILADAVIARSTLDHIRIYRRGVSVVRSHVESQSGGLTIESGVEILRSRVFGSGALASVLEITDSHVQNAGKIRAPCRLVNCRVESSREVFTFLGRYPNEIVAAYPGFLQEPKEPNQIVFNVDGCVFSYENFIKVFAGPQPAKTCRYLYMKNMADLAMLVLSPIFRHTLPVVPYWKMLDAMAEQDAPFHPQGFVPLSLTEV